MQQLTKFVLLSLIFTVQGCQPYFKAWLYPEKPQALKSQALTSIGLTEQEQVYDLLKRTQQYSELNKNQSKFACQELTEEYDKDPSWQIAWVLVYALNTDFGCLKPNDAIKLIDKIQAEQSAGLQLQWLNKMQVNVLQAINVQRNKNRRLRNRLKEYQEQQALAQEQLKELSSKIQALKAIENSINKKLDYEPNYKK
ncbi:MAG: hypothetical protein K9L22_05980 [Methylococcaceae bacterium]|nr:hypothetical protein [Methylococcaceae bacterium]